MLVLLNSKLPLEMQDRLRRSRDVMARACSLLTNPQPPAGQHAIIHDALTKAIGGPQHRD